MSGIRGWSTVAATNASVTSGAGMAEGMLPSGVNDAHRQTMADIRTQWEDAQWFDWGHLLVRQSNNSFLLSSTATQIYTAGRRLKLLDATTILAKVIASSPSGANTLVTVSGSNLSTSLSSGYVAILNASENAIPTDQTFANLAEDTSPSLDADFVITYDNSAAKARRVAFARTALTLTTEVDLSTGATSYTLASSIPSWVRRITINIVGFSTNGTSIPLIQIGDSGGVETAGYTALGLTMDTLNTAQTTGFPLAGTWAAATSVRGTIWLHLQNSSTNTWVMTSQLVTATDFRLGCGSKALSATLDRVILTTVNGTDTGDAGAATVIYE